MHTINQYSLKQYDIINTGALPIYYKIDKYTNGEYLSLVEITEIGVAGTETIVFDLDGVYRITLSDTLDFAVITDTYIIHNITDILHKRQTFLTNVLTNYDLSNCNHNQYYDFNAFNIVFTTYINLVQRTFITDVIPKNLYRIETLLNYLNKY